MYKEKEKKSKEKLEQASKGKKVDHSKEKASAQIEGDRKLDEEEKQAEPEEGDKEQEDSYSLFRKAGQFFYWGVRRILRYDGC